VHLTQEGKHVCNSVERKKCPHVRLSSTRRQHDFAESLDLRVIVLPAGCNQLELDPPAVSGRSDARRVVIDSRAASRQEHSVSLDEVDFFGTDPPLIEKHRRSRLTAHDRCIHQLSTDGRMGGSLTDELMQPLDAPRPVADSGVETTQVEQNRPFVDRIE
jgi:hypothetical protein